MCVVSCVLLFIGRCMLIVVRCGLVVVWRMLFVVFCLRDACCFWCLLFVDWRLVCVVWCNVMFAVVRALFCCVLVAGGLLLCDVRRCCLLCAGWLCAVRCSLLVVCCALLAARCTLFVVCCVLSFGCCLLCAVCCLLFVSIGECWLLVGVRCSLSCLSVVACCVEFVDR